MDRGVANPMLVLHSGGVMSWHRIYALIVTYNKFISSGLTHYLDLHHLEELYAKLLSGSASQSERKSFFLPSPIPGGFRKKSRWFPDDG